MNTKLSTGLFVAGVAVIGAAAGSLLGTLPTSAATSGTGSTGTNNTAAQQGNFDPTKGGHVANGKTEELLTGETAEKIKTAALAAYPGGTIQRVETDAEGAAYEAHMTKTDGSQITVKFDSNYKVTGTETGGPDSRGGPHQGSSSSTNTN
jgi:hypothetical protein